MKRIILLFLLFTIVYNINAQNPVTVQIFVQPPYSSHIEDYTSYENKLVLTLTGQYRSSNEPYQVYFKGFLQGDNGVRVETDDSYKPSIPVEIPAGGSVSFNGSELDFFSSDHLNIIGTDAKSIVLSDGLPEGYYHICIRAFDYYTDQALSDEEPLGCSADFGVFHIDPPDILFPICGESVPTTESQNIVFSWTIPVNSPPNTQYTLMLTELQEGQNPEDAANGITYPPFFEVNTSTNSYAYTMADPPLEKGKTYVVQVKAFDPSGKTMFKNDGYSEVCTFKYGYNTPIFDGVNVSVDTNVNVFQVDTITKPDITVVPKLQSTKICGKIKYKYPVGENNNTYPMVKANVKLIVDYVFDPNKKQIPSLSDDDYGTGINSGYVLATTVTNKDGYYCFEYFTNIKLGHVTDYVAPSVKMFAPIPVYRILRVQIDPPHTNYYEKYSENTFITDYGTQQNNVDFMFVVKGFNLNVKLEWKDFLVKLFKAESIYNTGEVVNVPIYLLRKKHINIMGLSAFPHDDAVSNTNSSNTVYLDLPENLELIAHTVTGDDGIAHFKNLVDNHDPNYQYYIYTAPSENNVANFKPYGPVRLSIPEKWNKNDLAAEVEYSNPQIMDYNIGLDYEFPKITGIILDKDNNNTPLEGVKLILDELYFANNNYYLKRCYSPENYFEKQLDSKLKNEECPCLHHVFRYNLFGTDKDGKFEFNNLAILHSSDHVIGIIERLMLSKRGYDLSDEDKSFKNKDDFYTDRELRMGEKKNIVIRMTRGSRVKGRVIDAETNEQIEGARIMIIPDQIAKKTNYAGEFTDYPALKLPGVKQLLVIEKQNYEPDTFEVVINKKNQDLGTFRIYKLKRRLAVMVLDKDTGKPINDALVMIKDVTGACLFSSNNNCPIWTITKGIGMAFFSFDNSEEQHEILVTVPDGSKNYEPASITANIPLGKKHTKLKVYLNPATCLRGRIYAGKGDNIPVDNALIKERLSSSGGSNSFYLWSIDNNDDTLAVKSDAQGYYFKRNVPLGFLKKTYVAAKARSQYIGDSWEVLLNEPRDTDNCIVHDFHLTVYDDMDITHLLGFPIYITDLKSISSKKAEITGGFININGNDQFSIDKNTELEFGKIVITAGDIPPGDTLPQAIPSKLPIVTDKNKLDISVNNISAILYDKNGVAIKPKITKKHTGIIGGKVKLNNKYFNVNNISLPEIFVIDKQKNTNITVFSADKSDKKPLGDQNRIAIADKNGKSLKFKLFDFNNVEALSEKSGIEKSKLVLNAILHTSIESIKPKDIKLNIGDIILSKNGIGKINGEKLLTIKLDQWTMKSDDWVLNAGGLIMNKGIIDAKGFQLNFDNFRIRENQLDGTLAKFHFEDVKLAGIKKLNIVSDNAGFSYVNVHNHNMAYQIDIKENTQNGYCAYLDNLPGMKPQDKIAFPFILLRSDGNSLYPLKANLIKLYDLVYFRPDANTMLDVSNILFQVHGKLILNYPKVPSIATNISFQNENGQLRFGLNSTHPINFTNNGLVTKLNDVQLSYHLLKATGTVEEPGAFPSTKVVLTHTPQNIQIDIAKDEKIKISDTNYFDNVIGEMHIAGDNWTTFWFEGYPMGMKGISDNNPNKMKFTVNGVVTASGQSIKIKKVDTPFGEMQFSYDLLNSQLVGYCKIDKTIGGVGMKGAVETLVNLDGWYFMTTGTVTVPSLGEVNLYSIFGDYTGTVNQQNPGGFGCLPPSFRDKISGFLISGYVQRNLFDPIDYNFALVTVKAGMDVGLAARFYFTFEQEGPMIGLGLKLYGHAYFTGSFKPSCTSVAVNAEAMIGIGSTYNTKTKFFTINGCAGISLTLYGQQCLGMGVCSDACVSVDVGTLALSALIKGDSDNGLDYSLLKSQCSDCD
jgi:TANFOR domain-containing protein